MYSEFVNEQIPNESRKVSRTKKYGRRNFHEYEQARNYLLHLSVVQLFIMLIVLHTSILCSGPASTLTAPPLELFPLAA